MSKPLLLVFFVMILVIVAQIEWRQQFVGEMDPTAADSNPQIAKRVELIKEKVILSQEKNINKLNELVKGLKEQLKKCKCSNETLIVPPSSPAENVTDVDEDQTLD
ncbi:hypothetical protein ABFX02_14G234900 [Erythranthe guttata]